MSAQFSRESSEFNPAERFRVSHGSHALPLAPPRLDEVFDNTEPLHRPRRNFFEALIVGTRRRWRRERRRRKVGRAYDMALEIAPIIPRGSEVLDVGCGNGFIAHHLSAMLGKSVLGIDLANSTEAPIEYQRFDGARFPLLNNSVDAVLFCYVLHHAQDVTAVLSEAQRVLRKNGIAVIYEDIPQNCWDRFMCSFHNRRWRARTGPCTFRDKIEWRSVFCQLGFEITRERQLSRWRNLTHAVSRMLYLLKN
jgi:SAM-dependent methyltransferase